MISASSMSEDVTGGPKSEVNPGTPPTGGSASPAGRRRLTAVDLADAPGVAVLLDRLGLGTLASGDVEARLGRNDNWAGTTDRGVAVFVKRLGGDAADAALRLQRMVAFERLTEDVGVDVPRPRCLGWDDEHRIVAFELLEDASSGAELAGDDAFDDELSAAAGTIVRAVHGMVPPEGVALETGPSPLPPLGSIRALPFRMFQEASAAELEAWSVLQHDPEIAKALTELRVREREAAQVPIHADLRLDQFLAVDGRLRLADWEEFRLGDAARDVGAFAGEWLHRAVLGIAAPPEPGALETAVSTETIIARGVAELERLRPRTAAFWAAYRRGGPVDETLAARATAFAGWHLLDRVLAAAGQRPKLSAVERAAAGIGRTALLAPEQFVATLGLGDPS